ncbi:hypothetical protein R1flu_016139 [Riccia fluitans]|uniref:Uncharacterized protein n=1 Tax=Riccia fluitans TaxID=41844 RepID=A0ABD1YL66_9MARC
MFTSPFHEDLGQPCLVIPDVDPPDLFDEETGTQMVSFVTRQLPAVNYVGWLQSSSRPRFLALATFLRVFVRSERSTKIAASDRLNCRFVASGWKFGRETCGSVNEGCLFKLKEAITWDHL